MKIRQMILDQAISYFTDRTLKLKDIEAPKVVIDATTAELSRLQRGVLTVGGDRSLLDLEYTSYEVKKGNGGKQYVEFDNGVKYFPNARYGRYITR